MRVKFQRWRGFLLGHKRRCTVTTLSEEGGIKIFVIAFSHYFYTEILFKRMYADCFLFSLKIYFKKKTFNRIINIF